jgi:predicted O-linked N-acetylglucosamine transferase (SPINDLY family)
MNMIDLLHAEHLLADAMGAWRGGSPREALRLITAVIAHDPGHVEAQRFLLELLMSSNRVEEAIAAAHRVIELAPHDAAAHRRLAELQRRRGDTGGAVAALERSLELDPENPRALNNLGELLCGMGRTREALDLLTRAIARSPEYPAAWVNLGIAHVRTGDVAQAINCYGRALILRPGFPEALLNLASAQQRLGDAAAALESYDEALRIGPDLGAARLGRARALLGLNNPGAALEACDALIAGAAPPSGARALRAATLLAMNRAPDALRAAAEAAAAEPDDAQTYITWGFAALNLALPGEALTAFDRAVALAPGIAKAHLGRARALDALDRKGEAIEAFGAVTKLDPTDAGSYLRSGVLMLGAGRAAQALHAFENVLRIDPVHVGAKEARAMSLVSLGCHEDALRAFEDLQSCGEAIPYLPGYRFSMQLWCCDWSNCDSHARDIAARIAGGERADVPFSLLAYATDPALQRACAEIYVADKFPPVAAVARAAGKDRPAHAPRLRVGYLSFDFRIHPVAQLTAGIYEAHDRSRFETMAFSAAVDDHSPIRRRIAAAFDHFEDISALTDRAVAERIAALGVDVLIDVGGHTLGSRSGVLAYRPAPVQVAFLGFPGTLGAQFVDYLVADRHVVPDDERHHYAERLIYMPDTYLPFDDACTVPAPMGRQDAGLPEAAFVFCCFNSPYKITPALFDIWMRVLKAVPAGILWLRAASETMRRNLAREASRRGVDPSRLVHATRVAGAAEHRARFAAADVFLDTTPYNAHTTAMEALSVGVPVITLRGRTFASRVATSLLNAAGLPHLSVDLPERYERLAVELASSPAPLADLKSHLRRIRSSAPLFDTARFCRNLETAFVEAAARARHGGKPDDLHVGPLAGRGTA